VKLLHKLNVKRLKSEKKNTNSIEKKAIRNWHLLINIACGAFGKLNFQLAK